MLTITLEFSECYAGEEYLDVKSQKKSRTGEVRLQT